MVSIYINFGQLQLPTSNAKFHNDLAPCFEEDFTGT